MRAPIGNTIIDKIDGTNVLKPIAVNFYRTESGLIEAHPPALGLIMGGLGHNNEDALSDLKEYILTYRTRADEFNQANATPYAIAVAKAIKDHVELLTA
ncbi:MAG TPA: hypothetical protein VMA75_02540 [Candidatus Paceibacterota bacterium]|nr:hypothetical protein [Candidatus Paceibacterota bacterium]